MIPSRWLGPRSPARPIPSACSPIPSPGPCCGRSGGEASRRHRAMPTSPRARCASLRAFLEGEQLTVAGRWPEAIEAYATAIKADSSFWLAGWRYNSAQGWLLEGRTGPRPDARIRITPFSVRGAGSAAHRTGHGCRLVARGTSTLARIRIITGRFPDDWSAWWKYADELAPLGAADRVYQCRRAGGIAAHRGL